MAQIRAHVIIAGKVQGVFFRDALRQRAGRRALTGWVRNRRDGTVEAEIEGEEDGVRETVAWCHKGPPGAVVEHVDEEWGKATGQYQSFSITY